MPCDGLQRFLFLVGEGEIRVVPHVTFRRLVAVDGEGMVTHHTVFVTMLHVAGVLVEQMAHHLIPPHHEHQRDDGILTTRARGQVVLATACIALQHRDELLHIAALYGLACVAVHLHGILIRRIVREVAADDEEVVVVEIGLKRIGYAPQLRLAVGAHDDGHDKRHLGHLSLEEGQLHLQTVLTVVCLGIIGEHAVGVAQAATRLTVHPHPSQWSLIGVVGRVHRCPVEPFVVAGTDEEHPFVTAFRVEGGKPRGRHVAREVVSRMGHDEGRHITVFALYGMSGEQTVHLTAQQRGVGLIEPSCLYGRPDGGEW